MRRVVIKGKKGQKPLSFREGGLHRTTHTPADRKIPARKVRKAAAGGYGPLGEKQAQFFQNVLKKGQRTARGE